MFPKLTNVSQVRPVSHTFVGHSEVNIAWFNAVHVGENVTEDERIAVLLCGNRTCEESMIPYCSVGI
jgi:hypothetical protein